MEDIVVTDDLKISMLRSDSGRSNKALVSFTGVGHALNGMDVQKPEFFRAHQNYGTMLFVTDLKRSWGNNIRMESLAATITDLTDGAEIDILGNSMGGFLSLIVPNWLPVRRALAFVPQVSVHYEIADWEKRWDEYRQNIKHWRYPSAVEYLNDTTEYVVVTGNLAADLRQISLLPERSNLKLLKIPAFGHGVAKKLKERGFLEEFVASALNDDAPEKWFDQEFLPRLISDPPNNRANSRPQLINKPVGLRAKTRGLLRKLGNRYGKV